LRRVSLLMRAPALFAFADRAGERRVPAVARHEMDVPVRRLESGEEVDDN
jgi:hypothetical protein